MSLKKIVCFWNKIQIITKIKMSRFYTLFEVLPKTLWWPNHQIRQFSFFERFTPKTQFSRPSEAFFCPIWSFYCITKNIQKTKHHVSTNRLESCQKIFDGHMIEIRLSSFLWRNHHQNTFLRLPWVFSTMDLL